MIFDAEIMEPLRVVIFEVAMIFEAEVIDP